MSLLRLAVVAVVLVLLARAARVAWRQRRLAFLVWRGMRVRHLAGSLGLLVVVAGVALTLLYAVPPTRFGLGSLVGLSGNAVFAPLEEAMRAGDRTVHDGAGEGRPSGEAKGPGEVPGPADASGSARGPRPWFVVLTVGFLGGLVLLFPWLAYVEERVFREGLERAGPGREAWTALKFGLVHMVMLIPLAAALAIAVAGFAYGRVYRRAYRRAAAASEVVEGPFGVPVVVRQPVAHLRAQATLESTVWHAAFNTTVVAVLLTGFVADWLLR